MSRRARDIALAHQIAAVTSAILNIETLAEARSRAGQDVSARLLRLQAQQLDAARTTLKQVRLGEAVLACRATARAVVDDVGRLAGAERLGIETRDPEAAR